MKGSNRDILSVGIISFVVIQFSIYLGIICYIYILWRYYILGSENIFPVLFGGIEKYLVQTARPTDGRLTRKISRKIQIVSLGYSGE